MISVHLLLSRVQTALSWGRSSVRIQISVLRGFSYRKTVVAYPRLTRRFPFLEDFLSVYYFRNHICFYVRRHFSSLVEILPERDVGVIVVFLEEIERPGVLVLNRKLISCWLPTPTVMSLFQLLSNLPLLYTRSPSVVRIIPTGLSATSFTIWNARSRFLFTRRAAIFNFKELASFIHLFMSPR